MESKNNLKAWLYLAPMLILLGVFVFYPLINAFLVSIYQQYRPLANAGQGSITGYTLANFGRVINDPYFGRALKNTFVIAFVSVPISIFIALGIAVLLKQIPMFRKFYQTVFFLPYVTNAIAIGMAFAFMFNKDYGLINFILGGETNWIGGTASWWHQMEALLLYTIWGGLAFKILVFTSGLENIDKQYYDAARIDSASKWTIFKRITVPLMSPFILFISITSMIGALKAYRTVIGLFGERLGAQQDSMITLVAYVYKFLYDYSSVSYISYASAAAIILFFITVVFSLIQGWISRNRVHY